MELAKRSPATSTPVGCHSGNPYLDPYVANPLLHEVARSVDDLAELRPTGMTIAVGRFSTFPSQELVDGKTCLASFDVPERQIHTTDRVVEHGSVAPIAVDHRHLPDFFDAVYVAADEAGLEVLFDGHVYGVEALDKRGAP